MNDEMVEGYMDGLKPESPEAGPNRSESYNHGFKNGRDDLNSEPRAKADELRKQAEKAIKKDEF